MSRGTYVDPGALSQVREGSSTKQEVVSLIGYPLKQTSDESGATTFYYLHEKGDPAAFDTGGYRTTAPLIGTVSKETQQTTIRFDALGVVEDVDYRSSTDVEHPLIGRGARAGGIGVSGREERGLVTE